MSLPDSCPLWKMPKINVSDIYWKMPDTVKVLPTQYPEDEPFKHRKALSTEDPEDSSSGQEVFLNPDPCTCA